MLKRNSALWLLAGLQEIIWLGTYHVGPLRENTWPFLALVLSSFLLCVASYFILDLAQRHAVYAVLGFALLFRITVLPATPHESEDVYRYLWDGRLAALGIDPFRYPPDAPELKPLRDDKLYPMLNSKPHVTAYPPVSQALFRLSYALFGERITPMKATFSLLEFAALIVAWRLLVFLERPLRPLILVAWNPFFIFEFSHSGHSDSSTIFLIMLSVFLLCRSRRTWGAVSYSGAVLSKLHPALWFPLYVRCAGWRAGLAGVASGVAVAAVYFTPASAVHYLASLRLYYRLFEFNAGIHYLLRYIGLEFFGKSWDQNTGPYLAAALLAIAALIWWRFPVRDGLSMLHAGFWIMTADLCLATTVHPWYLSWAALALPFFPYAFMLYWTGAVFLSYLAYQYRPVFEPGWVLLVEYVPMYAAMAWEISRRRPLLR